jgi:hypothetical protein
MKDNKLIELEINIKLLEYLKDTKVIDDRMYNYIIDKLIKIGATNGLIYH